jgi:hypothetical protein
MQNLRTNPRKVLPVRLLRAGAYGLRVRPPRGEYTFTGGKSLQMTEESQARPLLHQRSRFRLLVGFLTLLAALLLLVLLVNWLPDTTPDGKLNRIERGMSTKEVQEILGRPAQGPLGERPPAGPVLWNFPPEGVAYVYFDSDGKATGAKGWWEHHSNESKGLKDLISDWLKKFGL